MVTQSFNIGKNSAIFAFASLGLYQNYVLLCNIDYDVSNQL